MNAIEFLRDAVAGAVLVGAMAPSANAGRPLSTEDAGILDPKRCQIEAWVDAYRDSAQSWLAPACNFGAGIEWQAGFARQHDTRGAHSESYVQGKTLLFAPEGGSWSAGVVAGAVRRLLDEYRGWGNPYAICRADFFA